VKGLCVEGEGRLSKRSISAKALIADINKGLSDAELMGRHELSYGQLQRIFAQLVKAGYVAQEELDGKRMRGTEASSPASPGSNVAAVEPQKPSPEARQSASPEPPSVQPPPRRGPEAGEPRASSPSLPLSKEEASRIRRNGFIFILASYGFWTMGTIIIRLEESGELGSFLSDVLISLAGIGYLVTAILGCFWRVRGLGQHAAWAIVAPVLGLNLLLLEALSNRYEPESDRRLLRALVAVLLLFALSLVSSLVDQFL
jgi:hypothetical protein